MSATENLTSTEILLARLSERMGEDLNHDCGPGLFGILTVLAARKRLIFAVTVAGGVLAALTAFLTPNTYTATAVIMPPQQVQSTAAALLGSLGPLAGMAGKELGLKNPSDLYLGLLGSRSIADDLIVRFGLKEAYRAKDMAEARTKLQRRRQFSSGKDSLIHVDVDDTDPKRAAALANGFLEELNKQNRNLAITDAGQRRLFLENQLNQEKTALADAEEAMKKTQAQTGVLQIDAQSRMTLVSIAELKAKISSGEVMLQRLRMSGTSQNPQVITAESELSAMRAQLRQLEGASRTTSGDPMVPASEIPEAGLEYIRKLRDVKYHEFLFEMLSKQYEAARIDESKAAPPLQIVDSGVVPERKSGPPRLLMIVIGLCVSGALGSALAYALHWLQTPEVQEKLGQLRAASTGHEQRAGQA